MRKLQPFTGSINFEPSYKQYLVWQQLEPNRCDKCGGSLVMKPVGTDNNGNLIKKPFCSKCGTSDIPRLILYGGAAGSGKSWLGTAWGVTTCIRFPGARFALARKQLKVLRGTTFVTLQMVLRLFGFEEGKHYHINWVDLVVTFWNGSKILCFGLEDKPSDTEFSWLGSYEITAAYVDEASEVSEKAVEVLLSRCRWMIAETFIVPKVLMGTNPAICWLREKFVQDENGKPLETLPTGYRFVPATVFDNKDPEFVAVYVNNLLAIKDTYTRNRLLYGLWDNPTGNKNAAYHSFNSITHIRTGLKDRVYNKLRPLVISIDFNTVPQMSAILCQIDYDSKVFYVLQEFAGRPNEKINNTPAFSRMLSETLTAMGHMGGVIITGDSSGLQRSTQTEDGVNNYTILMNALNNEILRPQLKLLNKQPAHITRLDFINCLFENFDGWTLQIDFRCHKLTEDLLRQMKNEDGTKNKHVGVSSDGIKCELLGHFSDCFDYAVVTMLGNMYAKFKSKPASNSPIVTIGANEHAYSVQSDWDY